ncbi:MAG: hypothetical protein PHQ64_02145 [Bacilli bacterium]|nr:hypothetical protein [Bacilli bacterium]
MINKKKLKDILNKNKFIFSLFFVSLLLRIIVVIFIKTDIISDFKTMYDASVELLNKTSNYKNSIYFLTWGYQMGHVLYQTLILSLINSPLFLKILNAIITSFVPVMIYLISKDISGEKSAKIVSIGYTIFLFPLLLNNVLTNQHLPLLLSLIFVYMILKLDFNKKVLLKSIVIGLLLGISNILRQEGIVYITALVIYGFYLIIKKYNFKKVFLYFLVIISTYFIVFNTASFLIIKNNLSENGLKNMNSTWKFVTGFNTNTNGMYSSEDAKSYSSYTQTLEAKNELKKRISNYKSLPELFLKKIKITWINSDLSWSIGSINPNIYNIFNGINQFYIIILDILVLFTIFNIKLLKENKNYFFISLILSIFFGVYLLIEVMPRYAYGFQPYMFIMSSVTISLFLEKIGKKKIVK